MPATRSATPATVQPIPARPQGLVDWRVIPGKGRGVVARRAARKGQELERSPVIIVPDSDLLERDDRTVFDQYLLYWSDEPGKEHAMGGGLLMFYNHAAEPNVEFEDGPEPETISVIALRDIAPGEELTYDYDIELWFTPIAAEPPRHRHTRGRQQG